VPQRNMFRYRHAMSRPEAAHGAQRRPSSRPRWSVRGRAQFQMPQNRIRREEADAGCRAAAARPRYPARIVQDESPPYRPFASPQPPGGTFVAIGRDGYAQI